MRRQGGYSRDVVGLKTSPDRRLHHFSEYLLKFVVPMSKRSRSDDDEELDRALALSLAESPEQEARMWATAQERMENADREALDHAIASSLQEEADEPASNSSTWDCAICTLSNDESNGRCEACGSDRVTPYAARQHSPERREWRCGLPGCNRPRVHFDFCCEDHKRRAFARGYALTIAGTIATSLFSQPAM